MRHRGYGVLAPGRALAILVVDAHRLVAESVAHMLSQLEGVSTATSATSLEAARGVMRRGRADIVLVDHEVDGEPGVGLVERVPRQGQARPAVIIFSPVTDPRQVAEALRRGAAGWLVKNSTLDQFREAVATVRSGGRWVPHRLRSAVIEALLDDRVTSAHAARPMLSPRQVEVLACLVDGMTHGEVAERLHLSTNTVRTHVRHMCRVLDVHSTPALVALARDGRLAPLLDAMPTRPK